MKKILFFTLFVILMSVSSAYALMVKIDPMLIDPNETNTFNIVVEDVTSLNGFQFDLYYDPDHITIRDGDITIGSFLGSTGRNVLEMPDPYVDASLGRIRFGAISVAPNDNLGALGPDGDGILASIEFTTEDPLAESALYFDVNNSYIMNTESNTALPVKSWEGATIHPKCTVTASAGTGGTITPSGEMAVKCGTTVTFTITPDSCYNIADVVVDGESVGAVSSYPLTVSGTHTIHASFTPKPPFTIEVVPGEGGTISPSGNVSVACGANQTFNITPTTNLQTEQCYHITNVVVDGISQGAISSYTFENVCANHKIEAFFALNVCPDCEREITATAGEHVKIEPSGIVKVACGASQLFTITPDTGYVVKDVKVNDSSQGSITSYQFTNVTTNHTIHAEICEYEIKPSAGEHGQIDPSGTEKVACGASQIFTITPDVCYKISDVKVGGISVMQQVQIAENGVGTYTLSPVDKDYEIKATFAIKTCQINASAGAGGKIMPSGEISVTCGSKQNFKIEAETGYRISDVKVDNNSVSKVSSYDFECSENISGNHSITAEFEPITDSTHIIKATSEGRGTIDPSGDLEVKHGGNQTFTMTAAEGCEISQVTVNGKSVGKLAEYTFENVTTDGNRIHAVFKCDTYTIIATKAPGISIKPSGGVIVENEDDISVTVEHGADVAFTIKAENDPFCVFVDDKFETKSASEYTYTFYGVSADHTIRAFKCHTITSSSGSGVTIEPSGEIIVGRGETQAFTITADGDSSVCVTADGKAVEPEAKTDSGWSYTFSNVEDDHTIRAFKCHTITAVASGQGLSIEPSGQVVVEDGKNQSFTITAEGDSPIAILADGKVKDSGAKSEWTYTFTDVTRDHTIEVFRCPVITATGNIEPHGRITVLYGSNPVFSIKDCTRKLLVDGESVDVADTYQFANVTENHMIEAYADLADGLLILKILAGADIEGLDPCLDFNGDGKIDMTDALYVFRQISDQ